MGTGKNEEMKTDQGPPSSPPTSRFFNLFMYIDDYTLYPLLWFKFNSQ